MKSLVVRKPSVVAAVGETWVSVVDMVTWLTPIIEVAKEMSLVGKKFLGSNKENESE